VVVWPNLKPQYEESEHGLSFTLVPEMLEVAVDSDPRKSRVVLFGSRMAVDVPRKNEHGYECGEVAFYSQNVKARRDKRTVVLPELPLQKRIERLVPILGGKYPLMGLVNYSFSLKKGYAFVTLDYATGARSHLEKKDKFVVEWLDRNMPLPTHILSSEKPGQGEYAGKTLIRYVMMIKLPE
jgi:hypothetical protein